jgi:hypothetical protein
MMPDQSHSTPPGACKAKKLLDELVALVRERLSPTMAFAIIDGLSAASRRTFFELEAEQVARSVRQLRGDAP